MQRSAALVLLSTALLCVGSRAHAAAPRPATRIDSFPSVTAIRSMLAERIRALGGRQRGIGIVVGIIGPQGRSVIAYGLRSRRDPRPLDGNTVFETGSVGKLFTALALADMVRAGEIAFDDPVARYLPTGAVVPERNGHAITLLDLATHTSGLPFMPNAVPVYSYHAGSLYGTEQFYRFLAGCRLTSDPGSEWNYSNLGYWLLGQALEHRARTTFAHVLQMRIFAPLNMTSTTVVPPLPQNVDARLAVGHNAVLQPALPFYDLSIYAAMPSAGGEVSTIDDMLRFLAVALGYERSPIASSMALMLTQRRPIEAGREQAVGWVVQRSGSGELITHDGATGGYNSYIAWDPQRRIGVVIFSNQLASIDDIGLHLLRPNVPLAKPNVTLPTEIALAPASLSAYAGTYESSGIGSFTIAGASGFLTIRLPVDWGLPVFRLRPESRTSFFVAELPLRVVFRLDGRRRVAGMLVYPPRGQRGIFAKRTR